MPFYAVRPEQAYSQEIESIAIREGNHLYHVVSGGNERVAAGRFYTHQRACEFADELNQLHLAHRANTEAVLFKWGVKENSEPLACASLNTEL